MIEPKDIQTLMRLAWRTERARQILDAGYTFWPDANMDSVAICKPGRLFAEYSIYRGECDCPDFRNYGDFCKHTIAYYLRQQEDKHIDEQAALYAEGIANAEDYEYGCCPF